MLSSIFFCLLVALGAPERLDHPAFEQRRAAQRFVMKSPPLALWFHYSTTSPETARATEGHPWVKRYRDWLFMGSHAHAFTCIRKADHDIYDFTEDRLTREIMVTAARIVKGEDHEHSQRFLLTGESLCWDFEGGGQGFHYHWFDVLEDMK